MSQSQLLTFVLNRLTDLHIPFMVTGSVVSSLQGEPRSTHDIDMVIWLEKTSIQHLINAFSKDDYYLHEASVADAVERSGMFNLLHGVSGNKVDFWLLTNDSYDQTRFQRRQLAAVLGLDNFYVTSPEDTIISKLRWAKMAGGSEKQLTDATRVFEMQFDRLDMDYVRHWVHQLNLHDLWQQLISQADPY